MRRSNVGGKVQANGTLSMANPMFERRVFRRTASRSLQSSSPRSFSFDPHDLLLHNSRASWYNGTTITSSGQLSCLPLLHESLLTSNSGGGTSGCVVAARLAEHDNARVLLVEAGPDCKDNENIKMTGGWSKNFDAETDWNLVTPPMAGVDNRQVKLSRGKFLGGSSGVNGTLCIRGTEQDFDDWDLPGWSGKEMFAYMRKVSRRDVHYLSRLMNTSPRTSTTKTGSKPMNKPTATMDRCMLNHTIWHQYQI